MYDICYISANPGFLFDCLLKASVNIDKKYVIIFKETLPGGSWGICEESNKYSANHFFCSNSYENIEKFNEKNKILTNMELIEIDKSKLLVEFSKYKHNYKFYEFTEPVTKWIKILFSKIKKLSNIDIYNNSEVINITSNNNINELNFLNNNEEKIIKVDKVHLGKNTFIKKYNLNNTIYHMEKKISYNKHEFLFTNNLSNLDIIINTDKSSPILIIQNLSKYFSQEDYNLIVIRYRNYDENIPINVLEKYLNKLTGGNIKIIKKIKTIIKGIVSHENIELIENHFEKCNISFYNASNSLLDEIIFRDLF